MILLMNPVAAANKNVTKINSNEPANTLRPIFADASSTDLPTRIEIVRAGDFSTDKYGDIEVRVSDLEEMAANYNKGYGLSGGGVAGFPINFGHDQGGAAAAWGKGMTVENDVLYADPVDWTNAGRDAIEGGQYKFFSVEMYLRSLGQVWHDPENSDISATNVVEGGALTNIPLFSGLNPIMASKSSTGDKKDKYVIYIKASDEKENRMATLEEVVAKDKDALTEEDKALLVEHKSELTKEQQEKFGFEVTAEDNSGEDESEENKNNEEQEVPADKKPEPVAASRDGQVSISADRLNALEATALQYQTEKAKQIVVTHASRGAIKTDDIDNWTDRLVASSGKDREELETLLKNLPDNQVLASEKGSDHSDEEIELRDRVAAAAKERVIAARKDGKDLKIQDAIREVHAELTAASK